jgi:hypothetical protein
MRLRLLFLSILTLLSFAPVKAYAEYADGCSHIKYNPTVFAVQVTPDGNVIGNRTLDVQVNYSDPDSGFPLYACDKICFVGVYTSGIRTRSGLVYRLSDRKLGLCNFGPDNISPPLSYEIIGEQEAKNFCTNRTDFQATITKAVRVRLVKCEDYTPCTTATPCPEDSWTDLRDAPPQMININIECLPPPEPPAGSCVNPCGYGEVCHKDTCEDLCKLIICPPMEACFKGNCYPKDCSYCPFSDWCYEDGSCPDWCEANSVTCPLGTVCQYNEALGKGYCVNDPKCEWVTCPPRKICDKGCCVDDPYCLAVVCAGPGMECIRGLCKPDPRCEGVECPEGSACDGGHCANSCKWTICLEDKECFNGVCLDPACVGVVCEPGYVCIMGLCQSSCEKVICPSGQGCIKGKCIDLCIDVDCPPGHVCHNGICVSQDIRSCKGVICPPGEICIMGVCKKKPF